DVQDAVAGIEEESAVYRQEYKVYRDKVNEHIELKVKDMENRKEKDYVSFLINELRFADLDNTDMDELTEQANRVENAEKIAEQIGLAKSVLDNDTFGPEIGIKTLIEAFETLSGFSSRFAEIHGRLTSLKIEFDDIK